MSVIEVDPSFYALVHEEWGHTHVISSPPERVDGESDDSFFRRYKEWKARVTFWRTWKEPVKAKA